MLRVSQPDPPMPPPTPSIRDDMALLSDVLADDQVAIKHLLTDAAALARAHLQSRVPVSARDDLVNRFLEHLWAGDWRRLRAWRAEAPLNHYLSRIFQNLQRDFLREQGVHAARVTAEPEGLDGIATEHPDHLPEIALEARQLRECLEQGMALVTPNQQQLLRLRHVETLRHQDIALQLGRAMGTIASNLADAERALRRRLIGQCAELIEGLLGIQRRRR